MRRLTERVEFTLPIETKERLKVAAKREGISMSELIRRRVRAKIEERTSQ